MKFAKSTALTVTLLFCCLIIVFTVFLTLKVIESKKSESEGIKKYSGHQILKVIPRSFYDLRILKELRHKYKLIFWNKAVKINVSVLIQVPPTKQKEVCRFLQEKMVPFVIAIFDLQESIEKQYSEHVHTHIDHHSQFDFNTYHTLEEIAEYLFLLEKNEIVRLVQIGNSTERRGLIVVNISNNNPGIEKKAVFIECGIHAREWISPATCLYVINQLITDASLVNLRKVYDFYILPLFNPDGYDFTWTHDRLWRKTRTKIQIGEKSGQFCYGVDLNRNFGVPVEINRKFAVNPCQEIYGGAEPFSEPEAKALRDFLFHLKNNTSNLELYISLHSYGQLWTYPYAYKNDGAKNKQQLELLSQIGVSAIQSFYNGNWTYGSAAKAIYIASGVTTDWVYDIVGFQYCFAIEMRDRGECGFVLPKQEINAAVTETWAGISAVLNYLIDARHKIR